MAKRSLASDTFEQLAELGTSTAKKTGQAINKVINPIKILEDLTTAYSDNRAEAKEPTQGKKPSHTKINFEKLRNTYQEQDKIKAQALRNRLFQLVKDGEQSAIESEKRKQEERKKFEQSREFEQKKQEKEKRKQRSSAIPLGKQRRSIFSPRKMAQRQQVETRPSSGKQ